MPHPFRPIGSATKISATTASSLSGSMGTVGNAVRLCNKGTDDVFVRFGASTAVAVATDMILPAGQTEVFTRNPAVDLYVAAICPSSTATVYVDYGEGE